MDIALMSMALSQGQVQQQGEAIQKLMSTNDTAAIQHAAQPHLGGNFDLTV